MQSDTFDSVLADGLPRAYWLRSPTYKNNWGHMTMRTSQAARVAALLLPTVQKKGLLSIAAITLAIASSCAVADPIPDGWQASGIKPIGYSDRGGRRGGIKLAVKKAGERWYLYKATGNGIAIVDVTDPTDPKYLSFIDGPKGTSAGQITLNGNLLLLGLSRPITADESAGRADGWTTLQNADSGPQSFEESVLLYDISDPVKPVPLSKWSTGSQGTHRNGYPGGKYAFLSSTVPGYRGFILVILDVSDPKNPKEAGRWAYPGSKEGEESQGVTPSYHGVAFVSPDGKMLTLGYTPAVINLDITDIAHPKMIGEVKIIPPFINTLTQAIHTVVPFWDRKLVFFSGEPMKRNCTEPQTPIGFIDNSDPTRPFLKSLFPTPLPPAGAPYKSFCDKPGRFGPHNTVTEIYNPDVMTPVDTMYVAWFTAGLRAFDIRDARDVKETGWFLPPNPPTPIVAQGGTLDANATQDVLQDTRGNIFVADSAWGVWIVRDEIVKK
jgi:hypothetical protein